MDDRFTPDEPEDDNIKEELEKTTPHHHTTTIKGMYQDWFLDYASYVILERAIPHVDDGLKPVQRRILHSMHELDDGRYNKVANIVGNTMKYHPHGDASIGDAITGLGQKELMIDTQGNWGNILTGDRAAAPRYIEARLSKFALEVAFDYQTTTFHPSYDGRNMEPDTLPIKFPLLLAQGAKGIAVGLACEIMPHNFNELLDASIAVLQNKPFSLYPDFETGGLMDCSDYNDGVRGGRVIIRARIQQEDAHTLVITEIPYSTTSESIKESIVKATEKGQVKIKKIEDNTAKNVEIRIHLPNDVSIDQTIDALYAFTDCQKSISPNSCVIDGKHPKFMPVSEILRHNTDTTVELLRRELERDLHDMKEKWQWISLERIFIENEIYEKIKPCTTDESINETIFKGLEPFVKGLIREVTLEDVQKLRKIPIDRISKYNADKAEKDLKALETDMDEVKNNLEHLTDYAIRWFRHLKEKYGKGKNRKTEIRAFSHIEVAQVAAATEKLYVSRKEGFAGYKLKGEGVEFVCNCSSLDEIIVIHRDGTYMVKKIAEKDFLGKDIIHIDIFKRNDERTVYNMMYNNGPYGRCYAKRCSVTSVIRDREYTFTQGIAGSQLLYFSANSNGEAEKVTVYLKARPKMRRLSFVYDFAELPIKGKGSQGNIVDKNPVRRVGLKQEGVSTLAAREIFFDESIKKLNAEAHGVSLGKFSGKDKILIVTMSGTYRITDVDFNIHFDDDSCIIEKYDHRKPLTAIYWDKEAKAWYIKRFIPEPITSQKIAFFTEPENVEVKYILNDWLPVISIDGEEQEAETMTDVMRYKAKGKRFSKEKKCKIKILEPKPYVPPQEEEVSEEETNAEENTGEDGNIGQIYNNIEEDEFFKGGNDAQNEDGVQGSLF